MPAVAALGAAAALLAGASVPAAAQSNDDVHPLADHVMYTADQSWPYDPAGKMWFNEYGDVVTVCDNDADGHSVYLSVDGGVGHEYGVHVVGGEGTCVTHKAAQGGKYNLPEKTAIHFEIWSSAGYSGSVNRADWVNDH